jgi:hypothetical protein
VECGFTFCLLQASPFSLQLSRQTRPTESNAADMWPKRQYSCARGSKHVATFILRVSRVMSTTQLLQPLRSALFWDATRLRVVNNYHTTARNIPEERRSHQHRGGSLKSRFYNSCSTTDWRVMCRLVSCIATPVLLPDLGSLDVKHCSLEEYPANYDGRFVLGGGGGGG